MKVACLILAYAGAPVLARALPVYHAAGWDVFVHLDAKVDRDRYMASLGRGIAMCRFVEERVTVYWAGYSMMQAALMLIDEARRTGTYDRFLLLSDDTIPIFPAGALNAGILAHGDLMSAVIQGPGSKNYADYRKFFFLDHPSTAARATQPRNGEIDERLQAAILEIAALRTIGKKPLTLYYGSQFWCLTSDTIDAVLAIIQNDRYLVKSFEYTAFADEMMLQTIVAESIYKGGRYDGPVYADFYSDPGKTRVFAATRELPYDLHRSHFFVRKIAPSAIEFLDRMAARLAEGQTIYGASVERPFLSRETDAAGDPRTRLALRLAAPEKDPAAGQWHGKEKYLQQAFRWTAAERVEWTVSVPEPLPDRICFFIPVVISKPHFLENCRLSFMGQEKRLIYTRYSLIAEFDRGAFSGGEAVVALLTPPAVEAHPVNDPRRIGIGVQV